jgi:hypothetical protein
LTKKGRGQEAGGRRNESISPLPKGSQAPKFIYEKYGNIYFEMRSTSRFASPLGRRNIASLLNPLNLFMGITPCLLPSSSCLLKKVLTNYEIKVINLNTNKV